MSKEIKEKQGQREEEETQTKKTTTTEQLKPSKVTNETESIYFDN